MGIYIKGMSLYQFANLFQYDRMVEWHPPKDGEVCQLCGRDVIEVPDPHGDLVDHLEIGKILIKALDECEISEADKGHVIRAVWTAPTVIESEVEECINTQR